jgi:hypothetical protein
MVKNNCCPPSSESLPSALSDRGEHMFVHLSMCDCVLSKCLALECCAFINLIVYTFGQEFLRESLEVLRKAISALRFVLNHKTYTLSAMYQ